jgi:hypothetical protein
MGNLRVRKQYVLGADDHHTFGEILIFYNTVFLHTHDPNYLMTARRMANYFIQNIPSSGVMPWYVPT